jgi:hypothetical protein
MFLALLFLSFLLVSYCMSAIANQKFNQLYSRDTNLSKTVQRTAMRALIRTQEHEDPAPYSTPCQQEAAKETNALPQFLILSPYPHH